MPADDLKGPLEAVLFTSGDPIETERIAAVLGIESAEATELLRDFSASLDLRGGGIVLREVVGGWQLSTRPEFFSYIEKLGMVSERKLSAPLMETLAIIAFRQPVTKQEIEDIRGVHVERSLSQLVSRELIKEVGRKDTKGRPILYGTTDTFLRCLGMKDLHTLPPLPPVEEYVSDEMPRRAEGEEDDGAAK